MPTKVIECRNCGLKPEIPIPTTDPCGTLCYRCLSDDRDELFWLCQSALIEFGKMKLPRKMGKKKTREAQLIFALYVAVNQRLAADE